MGGPRFTVRALFLSDIHLGTRACQAERLLEFLRDYEFQTLYLVGDIIDFWALRRSVYWPAEHNTVVQKVLRSARHGAQVVYIPGNHDEALRDYLEHAFGAIVMVREHVHVTADGRRFLLTHGDEYDQITTYARWLSVLGDVSYTWLLQVNRMLSWWRRKLGIAGHWSLADYAKRNVQKAASFISGFETAIAHHVRGRGFDGVDPAAIDASLGGVEIGICGSKVSCVDLNLCFGEKIVGNHFEFSRRALFSAATFALIRFASGLTACLRVGALVWIAALMTSMRSELKRIGALLPWPARPSAVMRPALIALVIRLSGQLTARLSSLAVRNVFILPPSNLSNLSGGRCALCAADNAPLSSAAGAAFGRCQARPSLPGGFGINGAGGFFFQSESVKVEGIPHAPDMVVEELFTHLRPLG
jgi:UDP-2,3-diacylglucosamine pyrophosphatase LpxH